MAPITNKSETKFITKPHRIFFDEVTKKKIERHLSDINDTISDEDIRNVITDIRSGNADGDRGSNLYTEYSPTLSYDEAQQVSTSWNIID